MRVVLGILGIVLVAGCAKVSGPLSLYFVGSSRFTTGNRTGIGPADTLATNLYAVANDKNGSVTHFTATVTYAPQRAPFAYPTPITLFINNVPPDPEVTYLDSTMTSPDFLYTPLFGARTTSGTERWTFTATDNNNNMSARAFVLSVRRTDSLAIYHDYTLKLRVPATGVAARRFIDLKSGLALPAYSVLGGAATPTASAATLQQLTDVVVLPDGLRLAAPDTVGALAPFNTTRWPAGNRRSTRFRLTTLLPADFTSAQDVVTIQNQFTGAGRAYVPALALNQVYAFRTVNVGGIVPVYGLLLVRSVPNGTSTVGLQLEVRLAKQAR